VSLCTSSSPPPPKPAGVAALGPSQRRSVVSFLPLPHPYASCIPFLLPLFSDARSRPHRCIPQPTITHISRHASCPCAGRNRAPLHPSARLSCLLPTPALTCPAAAGAVTQPPCCNPPESTMPPALAASASPPPPPPGTHPCDWPASHSRPSAHPSTTLIDDPADVFPCFTVGHAPRVLAPFPPRFESPAHLPLKPLPSTHSSISLQPVSCMQPFTQLRPVFPTHPTLCSCPQINPSRITC
jgi:hypothetical protein